MQILTQDRKHLINIERLLEIEFTENRGSDEEINIIKSISLRGRTTNYPINLGTYRNIEKAQEILKEIMEKYEHSELLKCNEVFRNDINFNFIYKMPLEE